MIIKSHNQKGFAAFSSILVVSAVTLSIAVSMAMLGINESKNAYDYRKGIEALKIAESCSEEALFRLKNNLSYTGGSLDLSSGTCTMTVSGSGADRTIESVGQIAGESSYTRRVRIQVKVLGTAVNVTSWNEY